MVLDTEPMVEPVTDMCEAKVSAMLMLSVPTRES